MYCEELVESGLAAALLQLLEAGAEEGGDVLAWDTIDPFHLLEIGFEATTDERGALAAMVTALRLAADRVPLEHPEAMPLVVAQQETGSPDVLSLKQWVVLSLERGVGDKTLRDLTGTEVQMEPLAFVSTLATTLDAMLETQQPKWKDKDNRYRCECAHGVGPWIGGVLFGGQAKGLTKRRAGGRQKELRAMMHAFGDDPEGAPPSLLEHIKHLMVHEHRSVFVSRTPASSAQLGCATGCSLRLAFMWVQGHRCCPAYHPAVSGTATDPHLGSRVVCREGRCEAEARVGAR